MVSNTTACIRVPTLLTLTLCQNCCPLYESLRWGSSIENDFVFGRQIAEMYDTSKEAIRDSRISSFFRRQGCGSAFILFPRRPFCVVQVCGHADDGSYHSDDRFLLSLPCPGGVRVRLITCAECGRLSFCCLVCVAM